MTHWLRVCALKGAPTKTNILVMKAALAIWQVPFLFAAVLCVVYSGMISADGVTDDAIRV